MLPELSRTARYEAPLHRMYFLRSRAKDSLSYLFARDITPHPHGRERWPMTAEAPSLYHFGAPSILRALQIMTSSLQATWLPELKSYWTTGPTSITRFAHEVPKTARSVAYSVLSFRVRQCARVSKSPLGTYAYVSASLELCSGVFPAGPPLEEHLPPSMALDRPHSSHAARESLMLKRKASAVSGLMIGSDSSENTCRLD